MKSTEFPQIIKDIARKEVTLNIQLKSDNILLNSKLYYASDAFESGYSATLVGHAPTSTSSGMGDVSFFLRL